MPELGQNRCRQRNSSYLSGKLDCFHATFYSEPLKTCSFGIVDPSFSLISSRDKDIQVNMAKFLVFLEANLKGHLEAYGIFKACYRSEESTVEKCRKIILFLLIRTMVYGKRLVQTYRNAGVPLR